ncbi:lysosomal acid phosphatase-like [Heterodontus francisci]|uniref:lysosomal acid phosphatase-like n=1 Tax=Heterodontus francisci TaxID=7792 RepID=UPI00355B4681
METMRQLKEFSVQTSYGFYQSQEKSRLQGGVLLKKILQNMAQAINESTPTPRLKMIMYSAHDSTIMALQMALNVYSLAPPYAACHIFELYQENDGSFSVEMYYRNESDSKAYLLTLPDCTKTCPLSKFISLTSSVIPANWVKECQVHGGSVQIALAELFVGLAVGSCLLLLLIVLFVKLRYRDKGQPLGYQKLASDSEASEKMAAA